jgi:hypothetical protein
MRQRLMMVVCVALGAALVMMCDSDAVQDMVDGEEASATDASSGTGDGPGANGSSGLSSNEALAQLAGIECPEGSVLVTAATYAIGSHVSATNAETGGHVAYQFEGHCISLTSKQLEGPSVVICPNGQGTHLANYSGGVQHGLSLTWSLEGYQGGDPSRECEDVRYYDATGGWNELPLHRGECRDQGARVWSCTENGTGVPPYYHCSTREEAEALAAELGCP